MNKVILAFFFILLLLLVACKNVHEGDFCNSDDDCKGLDCSDYENQLPRFYPICEYNKCICGCGDPENGFLCR